MEKPIKLSKVATMQKHYTFQHPTRLSRVPNLHLQLAVDTRNGLLKYLQINFGDICALMNVLNAMVNVLVDENAEHVLFHIWI